MELNSLGGIFLKKLNKRSPKEGGLTKISKINKPEGRLFDTGE